MPDETQKISGKRPKWLNIRFFSWTRLAFNSSIVAMIAITCFAAIVNVYQKGWTADAASWAQAAGSIVAIAGSAWLIRDEARRAQRQRRTQMEEAAWHFRYVIVQAQYDAQIIAAELTSGNSFDAFAILTWEQRAALSSMTLQSVSAGTDHIHGGVIVTACNARVLVDQLLLDLALLKKNVKKNKKPSSDLIADIVRAHQGLDGVIGNFDAIMRGVKQAMDENEDRLPIEKWKGWNSPQQ